MLAARDQENLVHAHHQTARSKPLNQQPPAGKTPGARYPKTPIKIPLHDENAPGGHYPGGELATGKALGNGTKLGADAFVTPMGPRTRAPLGQKTTNAKARAFQTPMQKDDIGHVKTHNARPQSTQRHASIKPTTQSKLVILAAQSPLHEEEVPEPEYAPPPTSSADLPYESDIFPRGCLNYDAVKGANLTRGGDWYFLNMIRDPSKKPDEYDEDEPFLSAKGEETLAKMLAEQEFTVADVPETFKHVHDRKKKEVERVAKKAGVSLKGRGLSSKPGIAARPATDTKSKRPLEQRVPSTLNARKAARALATMPPPTATSIEMSKPKPLAKAGPKPLLSRKPAVPLAPDTARHNLAVTSSKSTIGYTKSRTATSILHAGTFTIPTSSSSAGRVVAKDADKSTAAVTTKANTILPRAGLTQPSRSFQRTVSTVSTDSDVTVTPERWATSQHQRGTSTAESTSVDDATTSFSSKNSMAWLDRFDRDASRGPPTTDEDDEEEERDRARRAAELSEAMDSLLDDDDFVLEYNYSDS